MFYSKLSGGFYPAYMRCDYEAEGSWPADAVEITDADEATIRAGLETGGTVSGEPGAWIITPPAPPSHANLVAQALSETREQRQPIIGILDGMQSSANTNGDTTTAKAIETAKQALKDITKTDLRACVTYEDMRQAMKAAYAAIVTAAPASVITAFASVVK